MCNATCTVYGRHGRRHPCRDAELSFGPDCSENHSDSPDAYIDMVVDVPVGQVQQIPRVLSVTPQLHASYSFLDNVVDMPVVFNDKCPYLSVQKTAKVPQLHVPQGGRCPWCAGSGAAGLCGCERPCDHTATSFVSSMWRCLRFSSPAESWTFPLYNRDWYEALWWR